MNSKYRIIASGAAALLTLSAWTAFAEIDRAALYRNLPKALPFPPGVEFELKNLHPSAIPGLQSGTLEGRYKGRTQNWPIQITDDGRYYILGDFTPLGPSKIPDLLSPTSSDPSVPQAHFTKNGTGFVFGELQDSTVDYDQMHMAKIQLKGVPFRGSANAPVAIVEYSDLECPYCRNAHLILDKELMAAYGKKVRWYFKYNPLVNIHPWSYNAAIAAACAARMKPDAGWKLEADFFNAQADPNLPRSAQEAVDIDMMKNIRAKSIDFAEKAGLDKTKFAQCYDKQESKDTVEADRQEAATLRLDSTPTFVINGRIVHGFREFDSLKAVIDEMLAEQSSRKPK